MKLTDRFGIGVGYFIIALLPQLVFIATASYGFISFRNNEIQNLLMEDERMNVNNAFYRATSAIDGVVSDLLILSKSDSLREFINKEVTTFQLAKTFTLIASERKIYDKIIYIDAEGHNVFSINYEGNQPYVVWPDQYQRHNTTVKFRHLAQFKPGTVYFSNLSQPVHTSETDNAREFLTVSTPMFDEEGNPLGMVALYLKREPFLALIRSQWRHDSPGKPMIVNHDGQLILAPNLLSKKLTLMRQIDNTAPEDWEFSGLEDAGQHLNNAGLFTYRAISKKILEASHDESLNVVIESKGEGNHPSSNIMNIMGYVPNAVLENKTSITVFTWGIILLSVVFAMAMSVIYSQLRLKHRDADRKMQLVAHVEKVTRDGVVIYDKKGRIISVNPAFTILTGFLPHEVLGKRASGFRVESMDGEEAEPLLNLADRKDGVYREVNCTHKKGGKFPIASTVSVMRTLQGKVENYIEIFSDISFLKRKESKLLKQAYYDALTRVPNRLLFEERLKMVLRNSRRRGEKFALLFIDINDFKSFNDHYGHEVGDRVLAHVANTLSKTIRDSDTVARLGGDEFVVIASNVGGRDDAQQLVDKLSAMVEQPLVLGDGKRLIVQISIGVSIYPDDSDSETGLTKVADMAMYRNKIQKKSLKVLNDISKEV